MRVDGRSGVESDALRWTHTEDREHVTAGTQMDMCGTPGASQTGGKFLSFKALKGW